MSTSTSAMNKSLVDVRAEQALSEYLKTGRGFTATSAADASYDGFKRGYKYAIASAPADQPEKIAPVQGYVQGIPWSLHLEAYNAYSKRWSPQQALIEGGCRGGFHVSELDEFIPGWRDRVSEIGKLKDRVAELEALVAASPAAHPIKFTGTAQETGERMHAIAEGAHMLIEDARAAGVVVTIETMPLDPLAMRNYRMVPTVRLAR